LQRTTVNVGPALRKVRVGRGVTLEEAARDTRVRREFLEAIEGEEFQLLLGDVHIRGCLRTYATYLRLSPDRVVAAYESEHTFEEEAVPVAPSVRTEPVVGARRRRDDHRLWTLVAGTLLVLAAAFGVLSARQPAPPPAELSATTNEVTAPAPLQRPIGVAVLARRPVDVTVIVDGGEPQPFTLRSDEGRSFEADSSITIRLSEGATARITVSGVDYGFPGNAGKPWEDTYSYDEPAATGG
jgi:cytoskeleton protein RodZ